MSWVLQQTALRRNTLNNRGSNIMDVTYLQMYIASAHDLNKTAKKLSDVNGSGDINIMDATQIQIIIAR